MKNLSNWLQNTIFQLQALVQKERRIGVEILELLWELERRKAYAELGYDGLFTFCVSELRFTESQAFQRIQAMRALKSHAELKEKLQAGSINVTTVAKVQVFLRQEKAAGMERSVADAQELFTQIENKSAREVTEHLAEVKGAEVIRKLILELDSEAETLWNEVRNESAHQTTGDQLRTFKLLMKEWLDQKRLPTRVVKGRPDRSVGLIELTPQNTRHIPSQTRRNVLDRDHRQCQNCGSKHGIQIEHKTPFAKGGGHESSNLTVLCRNCNLHQGVKKFGLSVMRR